MSEIINLIDKNPDSHVYQKAAEILSKQLQDDFSFVLQVWSDATPKTKHKKILILTSDETHKIPQQINDPDVAYIFKQYIPMSNYRDVNSVENIPRIFALPLCELNGFTDFSKNIHDREYDWCWMGQYDPYRRTDFKNAIEIAKTLNGVKYKELWYNGWNNGAKIEDYCAIMNNTKIALVPTGSASFETFRFFEAMMCGCVVLSVPQPNVDFYNTAPFIPINNWVNEISDTIRSILDKKNLMSTISMSGRKWHNYYCSPEGLSNYMLEKINA
jgi:hypothetical protein